MSIAVLISGGVDSAVVVHKLKEEGHDDLQLFYIRIGMDTDEGDCAAEEDIEMCTLIAKKYGLPLEVVSLHQEYWDNVMEYALRAVKQGLTPNPDMMCNRMIKFGYFEERWGKDFDMTATGHYANTAFVGDTKYLAMAVDPVKDQTDFLAQITYEQLLHLMFPIGNLPKGEVRRIAQEVHMPNAYRKDSQGICFLGKINYTDYLRTLLGERPGKVVERETGNVVGQHRGYWFHTIGQRKGLGLGGGPWFVVDKDIRRNIIYVSHTMSCHGLYGQEFDLVDFHCITADPWADVTEADILFKIRHTETPRPGHLTKRPDGRWHITSSTPVQGIAPGQFGVLYTADKRICAGSGEIR